MIGIVILAIGVLIFTFQYGQIYYITKRFKIYFAREIYIPIWLDLLQLTRRDKKLSLTDLHSNMVRFIIMYNLHIYSFSKRFTFQYGQIYYFFRAYSFPALFKIYIPIWLDLLLQRRLCKYRTTIYLHSNMVRFIIFVFEKVL